MSQRERDLIALLLEKGGWFTKARGLTISSYFDRLEDFLSVRAEDLRGLRYVKQPGRSVLDEQDIESVLEASKSGLVDKRKGLTDNFLSVLGFDFTRRQVSNIRALRLDSLNSNPFLIESLKLDTPEKVIRFNVWAGALRSVVTSFGNVLEDLLACSSESVEKMKKGWDLVKTDALGQKHWVQVKSGPNDMDTDQIEKWVRMIKEVESRGEKGYLGFGYGKRDKVTITLGHLNSYLPEWEMKTLIGGELWKFLSDDTSFQDRVLRILREQAVTLLSESDIVDEIEKSVDRILQEFVQKYGSDGVTKYLVDLL